MGADYFSIVAWVRPNMARAMVREMEGAESLGDLVGPRGNTVHDFSRAREPISIRGCARRMRSRGARPIDFEAAWVEGLPSADLTGRARGRFTADFPVLSVIDRAVAIPHGVPFLLGRAYRRLRPKARDRAELAWLELLETIGGEKAVARKVTPYVNRGGDAADVVRAAVRDIGHGFVKARELERDLVFACCLSNGTLLADQP